MLRFLAVIFWIALTVYAFADWYRTPEEEMPARLPRTMWLLLLIITIPSFSLGAIAWVVVRAVQRAEAGRSPIPTDLPLPKGFPVPGSHPRTPEPPAPVAPDDDPDFLFKLERDIRRERLRAEEERRRAEKDAPEPPIDEDGGESERK